MNEQRPHVWDFPLVVGHAFQGDVLFLHFWACCMLDHVITECTSFVALGSKIFGLKIYVDL